MLHIPEILSIVLAFVSAVSSQDTHAPTATHRLVRLKTNFGASGVAYSTPALPSSSAVAAILPNPGGDSSGLSDGKVAGIVVGSVAGGLLLSAAIGYQINSQMKEKAAKILNDQRVLWRHLVENTDALRFCTISKCTTSFTSDDFDTAFQEFADMTTDPELTYEWLNTKLQSDGTLKWVGENPLKRNFLDKYMGKTEQFNYNMGSWRFHASQPGGLCEQYPETSCGHNLEDKSTGRVAEQQKFKHEIMELDAKRARDKAEKARLAEERTQEFQVVDMDELLDPASATVVTMDDPILGTDGQVPGDYDTDMEELEEEIGEDLSTIRKAGADALVKGEALLLATS